MYDRRLLGLTGNGVPASLMLWACLTSLAMAAPVDDCRAQFLSGKYEESLAAADAALDAGQREEEWRQLRIRSLLALGRYEEASRDFDAAIEQFRGSIQLRWLGYDALRRNGQPDRAKQVLADILVQVRQTPWRYTDAVNLVVVGRVSLLLGEDPRVVLELCYDRAKKQDPKSRDVYLASGELALDKQDYKVAAESFTAGIKQFPDDADLHFGLALAFRPSDSERATAALEKSLEANPRHIPALLLQADQLVDGENYVEAEALLDKVIAINPWHPEAWAYRAVLAHLASDADSEQLYRGLALKFWPTDPAVDHLIGRKLSQKYRFAEGSEYQQKALAFDPAYLPAKMQLAQDFLRLGVELTGWDLASEVHKLDGYNTLAYNLVTLHDNISKFKSLENEEFLVRMDPREAEIYGPRVMQLLQQARRTLCEKYGAQIDGRVIVEIFPHQADFAVRTFGMPGGAGFLGVCFGRVITANSPASQGKSPSNWEAVLWHEFCHVVTLEMTKNKMPRWLSEGISVYEELQRNPSWGQRMTPQYREMILGGELTPVGKLSAAFLSPKTPMHLQFAYYESSLVVEYLVGRHGLVTLQRILHDLGDGVPINEALGRHTGSLADLERDFEAFARQRAEELKLGEDWDELVENSEQLIAAKQWEAAKAPLTRRLELYADDTGAASAYRLLAMAHRELNETKQELAVLEQWAAKDADAVEAALRLIELHTASEDWPAVVRSAERLLAVNPLLAQPHRGMAQASEKLGNRKQAIEAYQSVLRFDPADPAEVHYRLARLLHAEKDPAAKRHVLQALEEAPRFRAAHQLLLELAAEPAPTDRKGQ